MLFVYILCVIGIGNIVNIMNVTPVFIYEQLQGYAASIHSKILFNHSPHSSSSTRLADSASVDMRISPAGIGGLIVPKQFHGKVHLYVVWHAMTSKVLDEAIDKFLLKKKSHIMKFICSDVMSRMPMNDEYSDIFTLAKEHRSELRDFYENFFFELYSIRNGQSATFLSQLLPKVSLL